MRAKPLFCVFFCLLAIDPVTSQRVLGALLGGALGHQVRKQTNRQAKMKQSNKQMKYFLAINYNNTYTWSWIYQIKHIWTKHIKRFNLYFKQTNTNSKKKKKQNKKLAWLQTIYSKKYVFYNFKFKKYFIIFTGAIHQSNGQTLYVMEIVFKNIIIHLIDKRKQ